MHATTWHFIYYIINFVSMNATWAYKMLFSWTGLFQIVFPPLNWELEIILFEIVESFKWWKSWLLLGLVQLRSRERRRKKLVDLREKKKKTSGIACITLFGMARKCNFHLCQMTIYVSSWSFRNPAGTTFLSNPVEHEYSCFKRPHGGRLVMGLMGIKIRR